ncbi:MAG TPA: hypothetical protein VKA94_03190 [Hyphomicrobiales bacterium]|nr:hypothetical protein [Hyphomicrobiales bacterium]
MKSLSLVEIIAVLFTGVAGLASAVQAYVSWETRGEVSRAIVFAERIDACTKMLAAIDPLLAKAQPKAREVVAKAEGDSRFSLPMYYYQQSSGNAGFDAAHRPMLDQWQVASSAFMIVNGDWADDLVAYFDTIIKSEIEEGRFMTQAEMLAWLETLEANAEQVMKGCRGLL